MQFIDEAKIYVKSGNGGPGCIGFRREANIPMGGPDGGNGGKGGNIIIRAIPGLNTLIDFRYKQHFKAKSGDHGQGRNKHGASGADLIIHVPIGTQIFDENDSILLADITQEEQEIIIANGGSGGFGNAHYKSSTNQSPRRSTPGFLGEELSLWFKLKLLSDVGLVGLPNAGKSTFLSSTSRARPKIADYPFTTLKPQLGVAYIDEKEFVIADIPGLIKGAHQGIGLGHRFLKHIERCKILLHLIDITHEDIIGAYKTIRNELVLYNINLENHKEIIALNKADSLPDEEVKEKVTLLSKHINQEVYAISGVTGKGIPNTLRMLARELDVSDEPDDTNTEYSPI